MKTLYAGLIALLLAQGAWADDAATCAAAGGSLRSGVVVGGPKFAHGQFRKGVELSHTHLSVLADQDGKTYDVAIDNVYAGGYDAGKATVPAPLNTIKVQDKVQLCGQLYSKGVGIHWVHSNCGSKPTRRTPDGWLKVAAADGSLSRNYESNTAYCSLFK